MTSVFSGQVILICIPLVIVSDEDGQLLVERRGVQVFENVSYNKISSAMSNQQVFYTV